MVQRTLWGEFSTYENVHFCGACVLFTKKINKKYNISFGGAAKLLHTAALTHELYTSPYGRVDDYIDLVLALSFLVAVAFTPWSRQATFWMTSGTCLMILLTSWTPCWTDPIPPSPSLRARVPPQPDGGQYFSGRLLGVWTKTSVTLLTTFRFILHLLLLSDGFSSRWALNHQIGGVVWLRTSVWPVGGIKKTCTAAQTWSGISGEAMQRDARLPPGSSLSALLAPEDRKCVLSAPASTLKHLLFEPAVSELFHFLLHTDCAPLGTGMRPESNPSFIQTFHNTSPHL